MKTLAALALILAALAGAQLPRNYHLKLSTPVNTTTSKPGDAIRAAVISPESLLNAYLEGAVEKVTTNPHATLVLRFDKLIYKGKSTPLKTEVVRWVNSKGHPNVDDEERPVTLERGEFRTSGPELWLDEGSEIRVQSR